MSIEQSNRTPTGRRWLRCALRRCVFFPFCFRKGKRKKKNCHIIAKSIDKEQQREPVGERFNSESNYLCGLRLRKKKTGIFCVPDKPTRNKKTKNKITFCGFIKIHFTFVINFDIRHQCAAVTRPTDSHNSLLLVLFPFRRRNSFLWMNVAAVVACVVKSDGRMGVI